MPAVLFATYLCRSLEWGWPLVGSLLLLGWDGIMRPSEFLVPTRKMLILPRDISYLEDFAIMRHAEPKTRRAGARDQCSHPHDPDGLALLDLTLGPLSPGEPLWPRTPGAFRTRFKAIGRSMGIPVDPNPLDRIPVISPASLRGGAATEVLFRTGGPTCGEVGLTSRDGDLHPGDPGLLDPGSSSCSISARGSETGPPGP